MADLSEIPDEAVTAGVENLRDWLLTVDIGLDEFERMGPLSATDVVRGVLAAALPVLNTARPRLVSGDIPITDRTPHGVWIAEGPDPEPGMPKCAGLSGCDDCRAYDDLRQHLVEQITLLDERHQREMAGQFPGFYLTNDDGYPALTYYPREDEDGAHVKHADAGTSLDELIEAARKHAASRRGEQP